MSEITLLLVDDEERILRSLAPLFRNQYRVLATTEPEEALTILRRETVDVIISDQRMPAMLGAELLYKTRRISPPTMRILLTGYSDLGAAIAAVNEGEIFRYVSKPWNAQELRDTVAEAAAIAQQGFSGPACLPTETERDRVKVLVIEDDTKTMDTIREITRDGCDDECELYCVDNLEEATELLRCEEIGLIVTELRVDEEDTISTIKALKRYQPNVVTVVVTSYRDNMALIGLINEGQIYRFLPKPVSRTLLARSLQSALHHHRLLRIAPTIRDRYTVLPSLEERQDMLPARLRGLITRMRRCSST
ncbi:response regulator [Thiohalomonas denitrificans]|uniref:response regulator n=1 Tax=Thiohalomonas denitrificans TaxID=415747 RepID=UPI0026F116FE|nr:response regulator [Thiohalomonas denitrificans]